MKIGMSGNQIDVSECAKSFYGTTVKSGKAGCLDCSTWRRKETKFSIYGRIGEKNHGHWFSVHNGKIYDPTIIQFLSQDQWKALGYPDTGSYPQLDKDEQDFIFSLLKRREDRLFYVSEDELKMNDEEKKKLHAIYKVE